eukprot:750921-Amphidinium_carterae.2
MLRFVDGTCVVKPQALGMYFKRFRHLVEEHGEAWHLCCQAEDRCRGEVLPTLRRELQHTNGSTWDEIFIKANSEDRFWDREVRRLALAFDKIVARPARGRGERPSAASSAWGPNVGGLKREHRGRFMTKKTDEPICFVFNSSTGCRDPCPNGRELLGRSAGKLADAEGEVAWSGDGADAIRGISTAEVEAVGGLRDAAKAVAKLLLLRSAGMKMWEALEKVVSSEVFWEEACASEHVGSSNYKSFAEAGDFAGQEAERLKNKGFADFYPCWEDVQARWPDAV